MTVDAPLVSVVVPAYNAERTIVRTVQSLLRQTHNQLEVLVVDDGSRDRTGELVESLRDEDGRVALVRQENLGVAAARNAGIASTTGPFIAMLDADDVWFPTAAERLLEQLTAKGPDFGVAYAWSVFIDEEDRATGGFRAAAIEGDVLGTLACHNFLGNASCTLIRRECFDRVGGFDSGFQAHGKQGCEDWDFYLRVAEHFRFCVVPELLVGYRKVDDRMSSDLERMAASHEHMLAKLRERQPQLSGFASQLSKSSFYMYLAREADRSARGRWLRRAFSSGPIFCLSRPGFYGLWLRSLWPDPEAGRAQSQTSVAPAPGDILGLDRVERRKWRLCAMLAAQRSIHAVVSRSSGAETSQRRQARRMEPHGVSDRRD